MRTNEVKVRDLARELGVTSRRIIDRCRAEGWPVQNSITRLRAEWVLSIRAWLGADAPVNHAHVDKGPVRDVTAPYAARP